MGQHIDGTLGLYDNTRRSEILASLPTELLATWFDELTLSPGWSACLAELGGPHPANSLQAWASLCCANAEAVDLRCAAALAERWDRELVAWQASRRAKTPPNACRRQSSTRLR
jgi:hypothetical protein